MGDGASCGRFNSGSGAPTQRPFAKGSKLTRFVTDLIHRSRIGGCSMIIRRRDFLASSATAATALAFPSLSSGTEIAASRLHGSPAPPASFDLDELTVAQLQTAMQSGQHTARSIAELYLHRIAEVDKAGPTLNALIELNPDALSAAESLDAERKAKGLRGPLHGIPILVKDNIETA